MKCIGTLPQFLNKECGARFEFEMAESRPGEMFRCSRCKTQYYVGMGGELHPIWKLEFREMKIVITGHDGETYEASV